MTQEEAQAWVASLEPGDVVVHQFYCDESVLHIKKVTPSGIIRTQEGLSFKLFFGGMVWSYGGRYAGNIVPATTELLERIKEKRIVRKAHRVARGLDMSAMTFDFAKEFLGLCQRHGIET